MSYVADGLGDDGPVKVKVVEFDMTFWRLVLFLVKVAFAMLPALIILLIAQALFAAFFAALIFGRGG